MSSLKELRSTLLTIEHPEEWLIVIDKYISDLPTMGDKFELPKGHAWLRPAIEYYADDLDGWVAFVKGVRDRLGTKTDEFRAVHKLFKTLDVRALQRRTRMLVDAATTVALKKGLPNTWADKQRYAKRCIQEWKKRRSRMLANIRDGAQTGRVTIHERSVALKEFWETISAEIANGEIPKP